MKGAVTFYPDYEMRGDVGDTAERLPPDLDWSEQASTSAGLRSNGDVELWRVDLDAVSGRVAARLGAMLSAGEWERADRFRFTMDRRRFVIGRGVLRWLLAHHLGISPTAVAFEYGPGGKPRLVDQGECGELHFNIAHAGGLALIALTRAGEIGIDVELVRDLPDWEGIAELVFEPETVRALRAGAGSERREAFFREWTRLEAIAKAHGTGLGDPQRTGSFSVMTFPIVVGWVASLAVPLTADGLRCRSWRAEAESFSTSILFHLTGAGVAADSAVSL